MALRVETKIFVFVFSRKTKITKVFAKYDAESENAVKHPYSKRQMKFRS
jgi:hypothetical protein